MDQGTFFLILGSLLLLEILGLILWLSPPKRNLVFGFRTATTLNHPEIWDIAQRRSGRAFCAISMSFIVMHVANYYWLNFKPEIVIGIGLPIALVIMTVAIEIGLRRHLKRLKPYN